VAFVAGLPPGCAAWSPWPRRPGVVLVACLSRALARLARRRASAFGLAVAGPLAVASRRWLVAVRFVPGPLLPPGWRLFRWSASPAFPSPPWCAPFGPPIPLSSAPLSAQISLL
jgi:hypothetical protein